MVGGDPTALAIAQLGAQSEFETTLVRPKGPADAAADRRRRLSAATSPTTAFAAIGVDAWTAIAIATHDLETDRAALRAALPSPAGYVGLLGARRRIADRLAPLRAEGAPERAFAKLHAPIGLDIGGKAPWEVAVSVIGEIMALRYARDSGSTSTTAPGRGGRRAGQPPQQGVGRGEDADQREVLIAVGRRRSDAAVGIGRACARIQCSRGPLAGSGCGQARGDRRAARSARPDRRRGSGCRNSLGADEGRGRIAGQAQQAAPVAQHPEQGRLARPHVDALDLERQAQRLGRRA